jgi:hypothetical protein
MDENKLMEIVNQAVGDFGSLLSGALVVLGDRLDLYRTLAAAGRPLTSAELAEQAGCAERYVREWLAAQAASDYVTYTGDGRYTLSEEQATAFTDETSPACVIGGFQAMLAATRSVDRLTETFRTGEGLGWHEHHHDLFKGTERFFRPGYIANLASSWIPALDGVEAKLRQGAKVADVGCGHGASTIILAKQYPKSTFVGFDYHRPSIDTARKSRRRSRRRRPGHLRGRRGQGLPRQRLRPGRVLRLPARHGRPHGRRRSDPAIPRPQWDLDDRRALRQ